MHVHKIGKEAYGFHSTAAAPGETRQPDRLAALGLCQTFPANAEIIAEGTTADRVYKVLSGAVRTVLFMEDGRRQIASIYLPGDVFGLAVRRLHSFAAEAISDCVVTVIRRDRLTGERAQDNGLAEALFDTTIEELERAQDRFTTLGRRTALERVAWFLLDMSERLGTGDTIELPMCRQDIGDFLGLTIETVSRMMTDLERRGIISLPTSRCVVVDDRAALARLEG
jgi:CRP/FNR family nitrogen fixation transcriptional regulator